MGQSKSDNNKYVTDNINQRHGFWVDDCKHLKIGSINQVIT